MTRTLSPAMQSLANRLDPNTPEAQTMTPSNNPGPSIRFSDWCERRAIDQATGLRLVREGRVVTYKIEGERFVTEAADRAFVAQAEGDDDLAAGSDLLSRPAAEVLPNLLGKLGVPKAN